MNSRQTQSAHELRDFELVSSTRDAKICGGAPV